MFFIQQDEEYLARVHFPQATTYFSTEAGVFTQSQWDAVMTATFLK